MFCEQCGKKIDEGKSLCERCDPNIQINDNKTKISSKYGFPIFLIIFSILLFLLAIIGMRIRPLGLIIGILVLINGIIMFLIKQKAYIKFAIISTIAGTLMLFTNPRFGIIAGFAGYLLVLGSIGLMFWGLIKLIILGLGKYREK